MDSERGATAVEYGLLVALIAVVIIAAVVFLGHTLSHLFGSSASGISGTNKDPGKYVPGS